MDKVPIREADACMSLRDFTCGCKRKFEYVGIMCMRVNMRSNTSAYARVPSHTVSEWN